jgi:hypothetical protein
MCLRRVRKKQQSAAFSTAFPYSIVDRPRDVIMLKNEFRITMVRVSSGFEGDITSVNACSKSQSMLRSDIEEEVYFWHSVHRWGSNMSISSPRSHRFLLTSTFSCCLPKDKTSRLDPLSTKRQALENNTIPSSSLPTSTTRYRSANSRNMASLASSDRLI